MDITLRILEYLVNTVLGCMFVYTVTDHVLLKRKVKELEETNKDLIIQVTKIINKDMN